MGYARKIVLLKEAQPKHFGHHWSNGRNRHVSKTSQPKVAKRTEA